MPIRVIVLPDGTAEYRDMQTNKLLPNTTAAMEDLRRRNLERNNEGDEIAGECPCSD